MNSWKFEYLNFEHVTKYYTIAIDWKMFCSLRREPATLVAFEQYIRMVLKSCQRTQQELDYVEGRI